MRSQGYYSTRTSKNPGGARLDLPSLKRIFHSIHGELSKRGYFQEAFGYVCVDAGEVPGTLGDDIYARVFIVVRKEHLWPISERVEHYEEDDLFDMIEFLSDHVSKPIDGYFHSFAGCGMHYSTFNRRDGQVEFRNAFDPVLAIYGDGYIISEGGEIISLPEKGMSLLTQATLPKHDPDNVEARIDAAIVRFRKHHSRRHALRDLADVLEYLRPKMSKMISSKDESDLFNIINNFGILHHNAKQMTNYDKFVWYSWMLLFPSDNSRMYSFHR